MMHTRGYFITCDAEGCGEEYEPGDDYTEVEQTEKAAQADGWAVVPEKGEHYCPEHCHHAEYEQASAEVAAAEKRAYPEWKGLLEDDAASDE